MDCGVTAKGRGSGRPCAWGMCGGSLLLSLSIAAASQPDSWWTDVASERTDEDRAQCNMLKSSRQRWRPERNVRSAATRTQDLTISFSPTHNQSTKQHSSSIHSFIHAHANSGTQKLLVSECMRDNSSGLSVASEHRHSSERRHHSRT